MTRRDLLLGMAMVRAGKARAQSMVVGNALFEIERTSTHSWIALARPSAMLNCNAAIFELSNGLLVVDTHSKPSAAAALVGQLRRLLDKPVRYIVNTHFHYDHAHGNAAYRKLAPQASILATHHTREKMIEGSARFVANSIESMRRQAERAKVEAGKASGLTRAHWLRTAAEAEAYIAEMRGFQPDLPDVTFDEGLTIHDKLQEIRLVFRGRAHTGSDLCVWSPEERVLATGDLLVGFLPGMGGGYPLEWPATLRRAGELEFEKVLPGHGAVQQGRTQLEAMRAYIEELSQRVQQGKLAGRTLEQLQVELRPGTVKTLAGDYGKYVAAMTSRFRPLPPGADPWPMITDALRGNIEAIYRKS